MKDGSTAVKPETEEETPKPGAESAPAEDSGDNGSQVEVPENGQEKPQRSGRESPVETITNLRRDRRQLKAQVDALQKQMSELLAAKPGAQTQRTAVEHDEPPTKGAPSFFEDPERYLDERDKKQRLQIVQDMLMASEKDEALKLIRSQEGFDNGGAEAIADLMEENGLDVLAQTQPLKAAKLAIRLWREEAGISAAKTVQKAQAGSVRGGAPAGGVKKITRSYLESLTARISKGENVDKELNEAWAAAKEGRIIEG